MYKKIIFSFVFTFCLYAIAFAQEETLTITTYYPSPYGSYKELSTTSKTTLATDGDPSAGDTVGIGTTNPASSQDDRNINLDVSENIIADDIYLRDPIWGSPRWLSRDRIVSYNDSLGGTDSNGTLQQDVSVQRAEFVGCNNVVVMLRGWKLLYSSPLGADYEVHEALVLIHIPSVNSSTGTVTFTVYVTLQDATLNRQINWGVYYTIMAWP